MTQDRNLKPLTVYLAEDDIAEAERRADTQGVALGTLLRLILTGKQPPLRPPIA